MKQAADVVHEANRSHYREIAEEYPETAPHLIHAHLRRLLEVQLRMCVDSLGRPELEALDLGAGEGTATRWLAAQGAHVTVVDLSPEQLTALTRNCAGLRGTVTPVCQDAESFVARGRGTYDLILTNSFLHHVPDYLALVRACADAVRPGGFFLAFQDPLRYDTLSAFERAFSKGAYFAWRVRRGDVVGGLRRRWRRSRGVYTDSVEDNAEYHVVRNGLDQVALEDLLAEKGFDVHIERYFSTQSPLFQAIGDRLPVANTFLIRARKRQAP